MHKLIVLLEIPKLSVPFSSSFKIQDNKNTFYLYPGTFTKTLKEYNEEISRTHNDPSYNGFHIVDQNNQVLALWIQPPNLHPGTRFNTTLPVKLQDGDSCSAFYPIVNLKEELSNHNISLPIKIKGVIGTNDGMFSSIER